jgi:putative membrane protein
MLTAEDHKRIERALADAARKTSAGIYCLLAREASHYREVPVIWAALAALIVPPLALVLGLHPLALVSTVQGWAAVETYAVQREVLRALFLYAAAQSVIFAAVLLLTEIPAVRRVLTPGALKHRRVKLAAQTYFASIAAHHPRHGEYLLVYAAQADRRVEVVAGSTVHQAIGAQHWQEMADAVSQGMRRGEAAGGFIRAIEIASAALAEKFPPAVSSPVIERDAFVES